MNWLDLLLGAILAGSTVSGVMKGFARTVVGITATILGFVLAIWFYGAAGSIYAEYVSSRAVANFLGFITVSALVILAGALIGKLLAMLFKWVGLSWLDRTLGGCFGLLRGLLAATVIVMVLMAFSTKPPPRSVVDSAIAPYVIEASRLFSRIAPNDLTQGVTESYEKIQRVWEETVGKPPRRRKATEH